MFKHSLVSGAMAVCIVLAPVALSESQTVADPALSQWIQEIFLRNPDIQAAQAAVDAARGRVRAADQPLFNPELEIAYENSDSETTAGGITQTIDWSNKRGARTEVADFMLEGARAEFQAKRQALAADLLRTLADWHTAVAVTSLAENKTDLITRFVGIAERRRQAGDLGQVELGLAHLAAAESALEQASAKENLIRARQAVMSLTGTEKSSWPPFPPQLPDFRPENVDLDHLLEALPSMRLARARIAIARASTELSIREKRPDPTVGFALGKEDSETLTGLTFSVPLFVRNTFSAEVEVANAELIQAEREALDRKRRARADLHATVRVYRNARLAWRTWQTMGAPRLSQRTGLLDRLWQAGELDTTDYLVQLKQALDTEISAIEQRGRVWRAWADWLAASGTADQWLNITGEKR